MEINEKKLEDALHHAQLAQKKCTVLKGNVEKIETPEDEEFEKMDLSGINSKILSTEKNAVKVIEQILAVINNIKKTESMNESIGIDYLGQKTLLCSGMRYYETGLGEGNSGVIGSDIRPESDEYVIDRVAFYVNGGLVANIDKTSAEGKSIEDLRMMYAEKYGVDASEIELSFHTSYEGDKATGWLDRSQFIWKNSNNSNHEGNLEKALEDINKKFDNITDIREITEKVYGPITEEEALKSKTEEKVYGPEAEKKVSGPKAEEEALKQKTEEKVYGPDIEEKVSGPMTKEEALEQKTEDDNNNATTQYKGGKLQTNSSVLKTSIPSVSFEKDISNVTAGDEITLELHDGLSGTKKETHTITNIQKSGSSYTIEYESKEPGAVSPNHYTVTMDTEYDPASVKYSQEWFEAHPEEVEKIKDYEPPEG